MTPDYKSRQDLEYLRQDLRNTASPSACAYIAAWCLFHGLMMPHWSMRPLMLAAKIRHRKAWPLAVARALLTPRMSHTLDTLWDQTLDHLVNGTDAFDPASAGGWNEQELATFVRIVNETDPASAARSAA